MGTRADSSAIAELFGISPERFAQEVWGQATLSRPGGGVELLRRLGLECDRDELFAVLRKTWSMDPPLETATLNAGQENIEFATPGQPPAPLKAIGPDAMEAEFAAGHSIIAQAIAHEGLAKLAARLKADLGFAGEPRVNAVCGAKGTRFMAHMDTFDNFFIQVHGTKRWRLSKHAIAPAPRDVGYFFADGTGRFKSDEETVLHYEKDELFEVVMEPGDLLFVPAGALHGTETLSECSIGLSVFFMHLNFASPLLEFVHKNLAGQDAWSRMALLEAGRAGAGNALREMFLERATELRAAIEAADESEFEAFATALLHRPGPSVGRTLAEAAAAPVSLSADVVLTTRTSTPAALHWDGDTLRVSTLIGQLEIGGGSAQFAEMALTRDTFTVAETLEWIGEPPESEASFPLLRSLLRYGAIAPAPAHP